MSKRDLNAENGPMLAAASSNPWDAISTGTLAEREQTDLRGIFQADPLEAEPKRRRRRKVEATTRVKRHSVHRKPADWNELPSRLTVHVFNTTLMIFALPVGLAVMAYNLAFGEDMRRTAHFIALTGLAMSLSNAGMV
jgi:hypothetical protein